MNKTVDLHVLEELYQNDPDNYRKILLMLLESIPTDIAQMKHHLEQQSWEHIRAISHTLKPKMLYIGKEDLFNKVSELENAARNREAAEKISGLLQTIEQEYEEIYKYLNKVLENLS